MKPAAFIIAAIWASYTAPTLAAAVLPPVLICLVLYATVWVFSIPFARADHVETDPVICATISTLLVVALLVQVAMT